MSQLAAASMIQRDKILHLIYLYLYQVLQAPSFETIHAPTGFSGKQISAKRGQSSGVSNPLRIFPQIQGSLSSLLLIFTGILFSILNCSKPFLSVSPLNGITPKPLHL